MSPGTAKLLERCHEVQRRSSEVRQCARESVERSHELQDEFRQAQADAGYVCLLSRKISKRVRDRS